MNDGGAGMPEFENGKGKYLMYKGKPLVRENNFICYGDMEDEYILFLMILSQKTMETPKGPQEVPDMILVQVLGKEPGKPGHTKIAKQWNKNGLYEALDIGIVAMERLNAEAK